MAIHPTQIDTVKQCIDRDMDVVDYRKHSDNVLILIVVDDAAPDKARRLARGQNFELINAKEKGTNAYGQDEFHLFFAVNDL